MDRISQLPDFILHHILSFCYPLDAPPAELVRMSVLSKAWFDLTASFPILDFRMYSFRHRESFFKYLEYTTSRFCHQNLTAHKLNIITTIQDPADLDIVNRCLELLLTKGVQCLFIDITNLSVKPMPTCRLPNVLLSVSVLKSLTISGCELPSSLMLDALKFKSLIELRLRNVQIDDEVVKYLAVSCPLLQVFQIRSCPGFKRFCVHGHQSLQKVWISYDDTPVENIDIEAPNLSDLTVTDSYGRGAPRMDVALCKRLTTVACIGLPLPNSNDFTHFLSNFPFIKNLILASKYKCNSLKLSSHSLRTLVLKSNCELGEIELSTPNLVLFCYFCDYNSFPVFRHAVRRSIHLKGCMQCHPDGYIDTLWFQNLRKFLDKKNGFKVLNLYLCAKYSQNFRELERLKAIELPPYELEHVELQLESHEESSAHIAFVDALLWCCRPRSLTLRSSSPLEEQSYVVKFTYETLLQQEDQGNTSIQIVWSPSLEAQKHFRSLMCEGKAISFIKKKGTHYLPHLLASTQKKPIC